MKAQMQIKSLEIYGTLPLDAEVDLPSKHAYHSMSTSIFATMKFPSLQFLPQ
jgi:hypothetical protein